MHNPNYYVFVDVDGTLIKIKTMFSFLQFYFQQQHQFLGTLKYKTYMFMTKFYELLRVDRHRLNQRYYRQFDGAHVQYIDAIAHAWFNQCFHTDLLIQSVMKELREHMHNGAEIVMVSGSFTPCLKPLAHFLGIKSVLATELLTQDNQYTGTIAPPQSIGKGKVLRILSFLDDKGFARLDKCFAYGDHISDAPMLELVGHGRVIAGDKDLEKEARFNNWKIIHSLT